MPSRPSDTKNIGIWIRVSTEEQVQGESPEHHERRARAYAEAKGWHVAEVYRRPRRAPSTLPTPQALRRPWPCLRSDR